MSEKTVQYVTWGAFTGALAIIVAAIGWLFIVNSSVASQISQYDAKEKSKDETLSAIRTDVSAIKTNIEWLKAKK